MFHNRRSFAREILALVPDIESEFSGQIKLLPFDETDMKSILIEVTPSKGSYAHASFIFRVDAGTNYPFHKPRLACLTNIFHPNISRLPEDNICLNLMENWSPRYGLKDVFYALLFLLYEPNFDDPINIAASTPVEGLTMELSILKSFMGGIVNGETYEPNKAWCHWAEENNFSVVFPSSSVEIHTEGTNIVSMMSPAGRQQSTFSDYFLRNLSGQFTPVSHSIEGAWPYRDIYEGVIDFAFVQHITVKPACSTICDVEHAVRCARRYYYIERGGYNKLERIGWLTAKSACGSTVDDFGLNFHTEQLSVIGAWHLPTKRPAIVVSQEIFTREEYREDELYNDPREIRSIPEYFYDSQPDDAEENMEMDLEAIGMVAPDVSWQQQQQKNSVTNDELIEPLCTDNTALSETTGEAPANYTPTEAAAHKIELHEQPSTPAVTEDQQLQHEEEQQQQTVDDDPALIIWEDESDTAVNPGQMPLYSDSESLTYRDINEMYTETQRNVVKLKPWFWILYRTRWPPYLAPKRIIEIGRVKRQPNSQRVSSDVLLSDLFRVGNRCNGYSLFILVDSLSISPFSPIINRAVCFPDPTRDTVTWYSLDWFSLWDVFKSTFAGSGSLIRPNHYRWPTVLFGLCYVHNWVAYLSRMELYGLCLGYSRLWKESIVNYAVASCLTPATLGCGHCGLLDVWPLWLAWRATRLLCHLAALWSVKAIRQTQNQSVARPRLYFPFSDLDEI